ncbi:MAG: hypothetical protein JWN57_1259 [Frankiales bacterium]|nr:hypothetical protein [Frankiales bacterium]
MPTPATTAAPAAAAIITVSEPVRASWPAAGPPVTPASGLGAVPPGTSVWPGTGRRLGSGLAGVVAEALGEIRPGPPVWLGTGAGLSNGVWEIDGDGLVAPPPPPVDWLGVGVGVVGDGEGLVCPGVLLWLLVGVGDWPGGCVGGWVGGAPLGVAAEAAPTPMT